MRSVRLLASAPLLLLAAGACAGGAMISYPDRPRETAGERRTDYIMAEEMEGQEWANVYELVRALRGNWLQLRGPDTFYGPPVDVRVHLNNLRLGGMASLETVPVMNIAYVRYYDPIEASSRWGLGYSHGAIEIVTLGQH